MEKFGIKFAPLNTPLDRRLQTLSAFFWFVSLAFGNFICYMITAYIILFTSYWHFLILYFCWIYYDRNISTRGGRRVWLVQNLPIWKYFIEYFPISLVKTADIKGDKNYIFCCHPHGMLCAGMFGSFASGYSKFKSLFPGLMVYSATLDLHFKCPFFREYCLALGGISSSKESLQYVLKEESNKGNVVALAVGGAAESFYAKPGVYHIVLKKRKGFVKVALETGSSLVPVFSFGENELYDQVSSPPGGLLNRMQNLIKDYTGFAPLLPKGRGLFQYSFGFVPLRSPITTVVGKPIDVPKIIEPSEEVIEMYHNIYTDELVKLFEENKTKYLENANQITLTIH